jgi:ribA/ribD-fused uncharacterized protein
MKGMEGSSQEQRVIDRFTKEAGYEFLSNFHPSTIRFEGVLYPTVEHAYQASKSLDPKVRDLIRRARTPADAKKLGQGMSVRPDWSEIKLEIMKRLIHEKFENPFLRPKLLETEDAELILNNRWNDRFWGVCRGSGENWLGKILMEERERIKEEVKAEALVKE